MRCYIIMVHVKSLWTGHGCGILLELDVKHPAAGIAIVMAVFLHVGAVPARAPLELHLAHQPAFHQRIQAIIDRGVGYVRHVPFCPDENLLRRGMIPLLQNHVVNLLALGRETKPQGVQLLSQTPLRIFMPCARHALKGWTRWGHSSRFRIILNPNQSHGRLRQTPDAGVWIQQSRLGGRAWSGARISGRWLPARGVNWGIFSDSGWRVCHALTHQTHEMRQSFFVGPSA